MAVYEKYKDSGDSHIGMIPEHWVDVPISALFYEKSDKGHPEFKVLSVYREYGVIEKDSRDDNHNVTSEKTETYKAVNSGDFVINKMKAWQGSMGLSAYKGIVSPAYITCVFRNDSNNRWYIHYLLRSNSYIAHYNRLSYGIRVGQWDMHFEDFKRLRVFLPTRSEQDRIVSYIESKSAEIDTAIAQQQKMIDLLNERKRIIIQNAVTRGLNPDIKLKDSGIDYIGDIPTNWAVKKLKYVATYNDEALDENADKHLQIEYVEIGDVFWGRGITNSTTYAFKDAPSRARRIAHKNDIIISTVRTYLKAAALIERDGLVVSTGFAVIRPSKQIHPGYLSYAILSENFVDEVQKISIGVSYPACNAIDIMNLKIALPDYDEQKQIAEWLNERVQWIENQIKSIEKRIEFLQERKRIIINEAVTGKIKVS